MAWDKTHRHILEDNRRRHTHWTRDGGKGGSHVCHNMCARVTHQYLEKDTEKKTGLGVFFAIQVPEEEVRRWRDSGWYDEP